MSQESSYLEARREADESYRELWERIIDLREAFLRDLSACLPEGFHGTFGEVEE